MTLLQIQPDKVGRLLTVENLVGKEAIEQNPEKPSRWGKLAREGRQVVQFRDVESGKYVAAVVDGKVTLYGKRAK